MSSRWYNTQSRRSFLRGLGGFTLSLPFLESLVPKAMAASGPPVRFVMMYNRYGCAPELFWYPYFPGPSNSGTTGFDKDQVPGMTRHSDHVYYKKLTDPDFTFLAQNKLFGPSYESIRSKINIIQGLDGITGNGHTPCLGPTAGPCDVVDGIQEVLLFPLSLDRAIELAPSMYAGVRPRVSAIRVAPGQETFYDSASFDLRDGKVEYLHYDNSAQSVFNQLFGGATTSTATVSRDQKIVDRVFEDYKTLMNTKDVDTQDKRVVSNIMDLLSELQNRLKSPDTGGGGGGTCSPVSLASAQNNRDHYLNHFKIIAAAFACDLTRVASVVVMDHADQGRSSSSQFHDEHAHSTSAASVTAYGWKYEQFAILAKTLDQVTEGNGRTLLDNSVCTFMNGANGPWHSGFIMPMVTAGSAGGRLQQGHYIDYRLRPFVAISHEVNNGFYGYLGRPLNQLRISIFAALGIAPTEYQRPGREGFGNYDFNQVEKVRLWARTSPNPTITDQLLNAPAHYNQFMTNGKNTTLPFYFG